MGDERAGCEAAGSAGSSPTEWLRGTAPDGIRWQSLRIPPPGKRTMAHPPSIQRSGPARFPGRRVLRWQRPSGFPLDPRLVLLLLGVLATPLAGQQNDSDPGARSMALAAIFAQYDRPDSPGCIVGVGERGGIAYRNGFGMANLEHDVPMTPFTISEIGSVSKQFTAAALVLLAQDGFLSLDDEVRKHDPRFPDFGAPVTIRQLLNHTSGWRDQFGLLELAGRPNGGVVTSVEEVVELGLRQRTLNFPPNTDYLYSNTGFTYLNTLVERLSGTDLAELTTDQIFASPGDDETPVAERLPRGWWGGGRRRTTGDRGGGGADALQHPPCKWRALTRRTTSSVDGGPPRRQVGSPGSWRRMTRRPGSMMAGTGLRPGDPGGGLSPGGCGEVVRVGPRQATAHSCPLHPTSASTVGIQCNAALLTGGGLGPLRGPELLPGGRWSLPRPLPAPVAVADGELQRRSGLYYDPISHQVVRLAPGRAVGRRGTPPCSPSAGIAGSTRGRGPPTSLHMDSSPPGDERAALLHHRYGGRTLVGPPTTCYPPTPPPNPPRRPTSRRWRGSTNNAEYRVLGGAPAVEDGGAGFSARKNRERCPPRRYGWSGAALAEALHRRGPGPWFGHPVGSGEPSGDSPPTPGACGTSGSSGSQGGNPAR